jgi:hypothetical protein
VTVPFQTRPLVVVGVTQVHVAEEKNPLSGDKFNKIVGRLPKVP